MTRYVPDYTNIVDAAKNIKPKRIPIYEHQIDDKIISKVMNETMPPLEDCASSDLDSYFKLYIDFFNKMGYDTISFERILSGVMPGNGALYDHKEGGIKNYEDFLKYPWNGLKDIYFEKNEKYFSALETMIPNGMKAIGGVGNGIFECVQDITGYINLCYIKVDDPLLYRSLFEKMGEVLFEIWKEFLKRHSDIYCVVRMGDDLGFKTNTLLPAEDIIDLILPGYRKIIDLSHSYGKPFLLHSCGNIFGIMDKLIESGIDAKHSNEDEIAPMGTWYDMYGDRLGNFGGIDSGILCNMDENQIKEYTTDIFSKANNHGGVALGSGNSIPDYIPVENYLTMIQTLNELRCGKNPRPQIP